MAQWKDIYAERLLRTAESGWIRFGVIYTNMLTIWLVVFNMHLTQSTIEKKTIHHKEIISQNIQVVKMNHMDQRTDTRKEKKVMITMNLHIHHIGIA